MTSVLHVITGLGIGGAERMLVQLAGRLQQKGMPQHVVGIGGHDEYREGLEAQGVPVTILGLQSAAGAIVALFRLVRLIGRLRPDVLQGWMYHGNMLAAAAHSLAGGRRSRALYWNLRASNMDDARYASIVRAGALLSRWPDAVIANSEAGMAFHLARGYRPRRSVMIPNGIDTDRFRPDPAARERLRAELGIALDAVVAIHVARVDPMKDHASFIAALAKTPKVIGVMIGTGTEKLQVPPNVCALGQRRDVAALFACADLIVSTSAFGEGFSNVLAEGMSAGLIPIATDVGDARKILGAVGPIIAPGDVAALAAAIAAEACKPRADRETLGRAARARIVDNYTLEKAVDAFALLYLTGAEHERSTISQYP